MDCEMNREKEKTGIDKVVSDKKIWLLCLMAYQLS